MSRIPYQFFEEYIFRTPLFSRSKFYENTDKDEISDVDLKEIYMHPVFQEAIYLASPYLHGELRDWLNSEKEHLPKKSQKLKNSLLKYYIRMSTRSIPFGLFTGVGLGRFAQETFNPFAKEQRLLKDNIIRDTKLDMHFLVSLSDCFTNVPTIKNQLLFYSNNSIYIVGNTIRYIEYEYAEGKRDYIISSAPFSEELKSILDFSKEGKTISQLAAILVNEEITEEEAMEFVEELIDNQVLVSELEPNVSGIDFLEVLIAVLNKIEEKEITQILVLIREHLNKLDLNVGNSTSDYHEIEKLIQSILISKGQTKIEYEQKYLFQTDLYFGDTLTLSSEWKKRLKETIVFLNKITLSQKETYLDKFKKAFQERFENQEMPLAYVLDTEVGLGYRQDHPIKGVHPYLEDLVLPGSQEKQPVKIQLNPFQQILNEKLQENWTDRKYSIELFDEDFKNFEEKWDDLPDTISFIAEMVSENNQEKLVVDLGSGNAANLIARFCSEKSQVQNLTKAIAIKEEELNPDCILAEVIHLPEARIGNVIRRPMLRQYEIPYLAQSVLADDHQIPVSDLYISLKNNRIVLRSKRLNKEIKPYLSNAHNYSANSLPVYHFLCDLHSQNKRPGLYFNWGDLKDIYQFLPRIEYKNTILSKAWWKITEKEIAQSSIFESYEADNKEELLSELRIWRAKRNIPQWIQWVQSDNKLTINLENYDLAKVFVDTIKNLKSIVIEEFLYNENSDFMHQFIFPMYKEN